MNAPKHSAFADTAEEAIAAQDALDEPEMTSEMATEVAMQNTLLTPRFYTTDFAEMDSIDVSPIREDWDNLIAGMKADPNKGHFKKTDEWEANWDSMDPALKAEFIDFLISSCTAEFSGCVLYKEMKRRGTNPEICELFSYMSRDEARHAGFINDALREAGVGVNLGFLTRKKNYTYFTPKFIYYATYLSEKIGYARYITIFRHLEKHPDKRFHPIFKWFEKWCNDEFRHGEAFALIMKSDPKFTSGFNVYWIKFFLVAVFATMCIRDHARPEFHKALDVDINWYDDKVLRITSEISKQVFPIEIDLDHPRWKSGLVKLVKTFKNMEEAKRKGGIIGRVNHLLASTRALSIFVGLYLIPSKKNAVPENPRLQPSY